MLEYIQGLEVVYTGGFALLSLIGMIIMAAWGVGGIFYYIGKWFDKVEKRYVEARKRKEDEE